MDFILPKQHQEKLQKIKESIETEKFQKLTQKSHMTRNVGKPLMSLSPYVKELKEILLYDPNERTVWVEGGMTVETLAKWALAKGLIIPIVPEFKKITIGGAIVGAALESSSFRYGQFNDPCLAVEVFLPNGKTVFASPSENQDLFYTLPGSYGTLGAITAVKLPLFPAKEYVELTCFLYSIEEALSFIEEASKEKVLDYLDAVIISKDKVIVMQGKQKTKRQIGKESKKIHFSYPWSEWMISHLINDQNQKQWVYHLSLEDYLFRFDLGAFWMGQFVNFKTAFRFLFEYGFKDKTLISSLLQAYEKEPPNLTPSLGLRMLSGWKLSSEEMYKTFHSIPEKISRDLFFVHDFYLPFKKVKEFFFFIDKEVGIYPLWLCPMKATEEEQFLSPHFQRQNSSPDYINVGIYGIAFSKKEEAKVLTKKVEEKVHQLGGRKILYSANEYRKDEFWKIYDRARYDAVREKYGCKDFPDLFQKI